MEAPLLLGARGDDHGLEVDRPHAAPADSSADAHACTTASNASNIPRNTMIIFSSPTYPDLFANANKSEATILVARTISRLPRSPRHPDDNHYYRRAICEPSP
jgi:hypothetical protein